MYNHAPCISAYIYDATGRYEGWLSAAISFDGQRLACAVDGGIIIYDVKTLNTVRQWRGTPECSGTPFVCFSQNGDRLAWAALCVSQDHGATTNIAVWETRMPDKPLWVVKVFAGHSYPKCMEFSPNGKMFALLDHGGDVIILDALSGTTITTKAGLGEHVESLKWSADGALALRIKRARVDAEFDLCIGHVDSIAGEFRIVSPEARRAELYSFPVGFSRRRTIAAQPVHSRGIRMGGTMKKAKIDHWKLKNWVPRSISLSPDGEFIAFTAEFCVVVRDVRTGQEVGILPSGTESIRHAAFALATEGANTGKRLSLVWVTEKNELRVWDLSTLYVTHGRGTDSEVKESQDLLAMRRWTSESRPFSICELSLSPDGKRLFSLLNKHVQTWNAHTGRLILELNGPTYWTAFVPILGKLITALQGPTDAVNIAFAPRTHQVASRQKDFSAVLWDIMTGKVHSQLNGHTDLVTKATFSSDSTLIATHAKDRTLRVWKTSTGEQIFCTTCVESLDLPVFAFTPNQTTLLFIQKTSCLFYDIGKGDVRTAILQTSRPITSAHISPDCTKMLADTGEGLRVFNLLHEEAIATCALEDSESFYHFSFYARGERVVASRPAYSNSDLVGMWDSQTGKKFRQVNHYSELRPFWSQDRNDILMGTKDGSVHIIDLSKSVSAEWDEEGWLVEGFNGVEEQKGEDSDDASSTSSPSVGNSPRNKRRLMWLPPQTCQILYREYTKLIISPRGSAKLDLSNACFGEDWVKCYSNNGNGA